MKALNLKFLATVAVVGALCFLSGRSSGLSATADAAAADASETVRFRANVVHTYNDDGSSSRNVLFSVQQSTVSPVLLDWIAAEPNRLYFEARLVPIQEEGDR